MSEKTVTRANPVSEEDELDKEKQKSKNNDSCVTAPVDNQRSDERLRQDITYRDQQQAIARERCQTFSNLQPLQLVFSDGETKVGFRSEEYALKEVGDAKDGGATAKLSDADVSRSRYLQRTLIDNVRTALPELEMRMRQLETKDKKNALGILDPKADEKYSDYLVRMKAMLKAEREAGIYGPVTREMFDRYAKRLEILLPEAIKKMAGLGLELPANCPIQLPLNEYLRRIHPTLFKAMGVTDDLALPLAKADKTKPPSDDDLDVLDSGFDFVETCNRTVKVAGEAHRAKQLMESIRDLNLPAGWNLKEGENVAIWCDSAKRMIEMAISTRALIAANQILARDMARYGDYPVKLPIGTELEVEYKNTKHTIKSDDLGDPQKLEIFVKGNITGYKLPLPDTLEQQDSVNRQKLEDLMVWNKTQGELLHKSQERLQALVTNTDGAIMYGDRELKNRMGAFDSNNRFVRSVDMSNVAQVNLAKQEGLRLEKINLIGFDYEAGLVTDKKDPNYGKIKLTQKIQAELAGEAAYLNCRLFSKSFAGPFGIDKVGEPMNVDKPRYFDPNEFVAVYNGEKAQLIQAKDLNHFRTVQQLWYRGEKTAELAFDVATLVDIALDGGAVTMSLRAGAKLAAKEGAAIAEKQVAKMTLREAEMFGLKSAPKVLAAVAAITNNAGAHDTGWGQAAEYYRMGYYSLDMARSISPSWKAIRGLAGGAKAAEAARELTVFEKVAQMKKDVGWLRSPDKANHVMFKTLEVAFVLNALKDGSKRIGNAVMGPQRDPIHDLKDLVGDGRGVIPVMRGNSFDPKDKGVQAATREVFASYSAGLKAGRKADIQQKIDSIFSRTSDAIDPDKKIDREALKAEFVGNLNFTASQVQELQRASGKSGYVLSVQQLKDLNAPGRLNDPEVLKNLPQPVRDLAARFVSEREPGVTAASRIALLYLNRNSDGKVDDSVGSVLIDSPTGKLNVSLSALENVEAMKREVGRGGDCSVVIADSLRKLEAIENQEMAITIQKVLKNPDASKEVKIRAMVDSTGARVASLHDILAARQVAGTDNPSEGRNLNAAAVDIFRTLEQTAKSDKNPDVRALAAGLLFGLRDNDEKRHGPWLNLMNNLARNSVKDVGLLDAKVSDALVTQLTIPIPDDPQMADRVREIRLNAAKSLALMTQADDKVTQKAIDKELVASLSRTDQRLNARILDFIVTHRLATLQSLQPELLAKLRAQVVDLVNVPKKVVVGGKNVYVPDPDGTVAILKAMPALFCGSIPTTEAETPVVTTLRAKLQGFLGAGSAELNDFPEIRAASIKMLQALSDGDSIGLIRKYISPLKEVIIDGKPFATGEKDARVRLAAVEALDQLKDPHLPKILDQLIESEPDVGVATKLHAIEVIRAPFEVSDKAAANHLDELLAIIKKAATAEKDYDPVKWLRGYSKEEEARGVTNNGDFRQFSIDELNNLTKNGAFPLWDEKYYTGYLNKTLYNAGEGVLWGAFVSRSTETNSIISITKKRMEQWKEIEKMAKGSDEKSIPNAIRARAALVYMIEESGGEGGRLYGGKAFKLDKGYSVNEKKPLYEANADWTLLAAKVLKDCCTPGTPASDVTLASLQKALEKNNTRPEVTMVLLEGLRNLHANKMCSDAQAAAIASNVWQIEMKRQPGDPHNDQLNKRAGVQSMAVQEALLSDLERYNYKMLYPTLLAVKAASSFPYLRDRAKELADKLHYSNEVPWKESTPQVWEPKGRVARLQEALKSNNVHDTVVGIFSAYKGQVISDLADPALLPLSRALHDKSERVRIAAARILAYSTLPADHPVRLQAIKSMEQIQSKGSQQRYKLEAATELLFLKGSPRQLHLMDYPFEQPR